jgi:hypothetical protein
MKALLQSVAEREQITESALVRQLLESLLRVSSEEGAPRIGVRENGPHIT